MGNVRTTGNAFGGFPPSCTKLDKEGKTTTPKKMSAVRYQNDTKPDTGLEKEKRSQNDKRMI